MALTRETSRKKADAIKARYEHWINQKEGNVRKYTFEYIMLQLGKEFYISPRTAEEIVNGWGYYKEPEPDNQPELFNEDGEPKE